jgi:hypothetical protein
MSDAASPLYLFRTSRNIGMFHDSFLSPLYHQLPRLKRERERERDAGKMIVLSSAPISHLHTFPSKMQVQKQITQTQSLSLIQNILLSSIGSVSYIRGLFPGK